jgi:mannitol-1-phosphate 5-dehydrogenase
MKNKKLVLFGAGKIGRSFIGPLFSRSGYEVVFIDIDERIIDALNRNKRYKVVIKSDGGDEDVWVENVRGVLASNIEEVIDEVASAGIMAISVGQNALSKIAPLIAKGLELRDEKHPGIPLDIILAENLRDAAQVVGAELKKHLSSAFDLDEKVGLVETSIGKMVPIMSLNETDNDPLLVYAEPYNSLILDRKGFKNPIPDVAGLAPKDNMAAWVDRKSFIHNLGHAAAAYFGYLRYPDMIFLFEVMRQKDVYERTRATMLQAANVLMKQYADEFAKADLIAHVDDLLHRFSNKALGDTVFRVGQDLYRKLGPEDRLVGVFKMAIKYNMPYDKILYIIACSIKFKATDEHGLRSDRDIKFGKESDMGITHILETVCMLSKEKFPDVHREAEELKIQCT